MTTVSYRTWKVRQHIARLVLFSAIALLILPTFAFGTSKAAGTRPIFITAASVASLSPPLSSTTQLPPLARLSSFVQ
jgi:hypothetical protein